jgi:hypothetical protein
MNTAFVPAILEGFREVVTEFQFEMSTDHNKVFDEVLFRNEKCVFRFMYDMGYVLCDFIDPVEKATSADYPTYPVYAVWQFLYPGETGYLEYEGSDLTSQVLDNKQLILERLRKVLEGDFSWTAAYREAESRVSNKVEYMMNHWAADNPVIRKYEKGDPGWEKAFNEYKNFLDKL